MMKWALVGLAALLCVVLVLVTAAGCDGGGSSGSASPGQVVKDFWESAARGDARAAYALFSSADQAELSYADFEKMVGEDPPGEDFKVEVFSEIDQRRYRHRESFIGGGNTDFDLVKEGGAWKLDGIAGYVSRSRKGC